MKDKILSLLYIIVPLVIWEAAAQLGLTNSRFFGSPTEILLASQEILTSPLNRTYIASSLMAVFVGLLISIVLGIVIGLFVGINSKVGKIVLFYLYGLDSFPMVVLLPLFIIWFGIGFSTKVALIVLMAVVPIIINVSEGVKSIDIKILEMVDSFKLSFYKEVMYVYLPGSINGIFTGIKLARGRALVALVIAEFFGLDFGVGYLISYYGSIMRINEIMFLILIILLINYTIMSVVRYFEKITLKSYR